MKEIEEVIAYRCPYCGCVNYSKETIKKHMKVCRKNPEYTQKCITCNCLEKDYQLKAIDGKPLCIHENRCPYCNHDNTEIKTIIEENKIDYKAYLESCGVGKTEKISIMKKSWNSN